MTTLNNVEEEIAFLIKDNSDKVYYQISNLKQLGEFELIDRSLTEITDVYLDTEDKLLMSNGTVLRIRFENEQKFITYKWRLNNNKRFEKEIPYTTKMFKHARTILDVLDKVLICVHERTVHRQTVGIIINGTHVADMCIDIISFRVTDEQDRINPKCEFVWFYQIEVENKSELQDYSRFAELLRKKFKLITCKDSKTETCMKIQDQWKKNKSFRKLVDKSGRLKQKAFN